MSGLEDTETLRQQIIDACLWMERAGVNQGTSGNISVRVTDGILMTPSALPYDRMTPDQICKLSLNGPPADDMRPRPTTEWQFHQAVMQARPDVNVVVHAHPAHATAIATQRRGIPAVHYMVAAFGGADVPIVDYALYGGRSLADGVANALENRHACLLANHGAVAVGPTMDRALWRMQELEILARVYILATTSGEPVLLTEAEIAEVLVSFESYGRQ